MSTGTAEPHPFKGRKIARCQVGERIGRGATSHVHKAHYEPLQKQIALKILDHRSAGIEELRSRFLSEAKTIARLDHENIVKVYDVVEDQGLLCILMEYVPGDTIQDLLDDRGALPARLAARFTLQIARALEAAHDEGVVHRDVKPANAIVVAGTEDVKVVDFGLAAKGSANRVGTPLYMSPEAAQGKRIDEKSDVYALGVSLYQMLTGRHPFTGKSVREILAAHVEGAYVPPSKAKPDVGPKYDEIVKRMLVKSKGYRPSAGDVVEALSEILGEDARKVGKGGKAGRGRRAPARKPSKAPLVLGIAGAAVALVVAVLLLASGGGDAPTAPGTPSGEQARDPRQPGGGGIEGGAPAATPATDPDAPARHAYEVAERYASENPDALEDLVRRWRTAEVAAAGTPWGERAAERRTAAEAELERRKAAAAAEEQARKERAERLAASKAAHEQVEQLVAARDFAGAFDRAQALGSPDGVSAAAWRKRLNRLEHLGERFVPRMAEALRDMQPRIPAARVKPGSGSEAVLVGADAAGIEVENAGIEGRIPWGELSADVLFHDLAKKVLSQSDPDDALLLAVLAQEVGLARESKQFREIVELVDTTGTSKERLAPYFDD